MSIARAWQGEAFYAWVVIGVCTAMVAMGFGALMIIAVFLTPLAAEFGWPRGDLSLAYAIATLGTGLGGVLMGYFSDRVPARWVALLGAVAGGVALLLLSRVETTAELYFCHALLGILGGGALMAPLNSLASAWMPRNPGLAIGIVSAGGALGQGVLPFLARHLVLVEGWRQAYVTLGVLYLLVMVPLALVIRNPPELAARAGTASLRSDNPYAIPRGWLLAILSVAVAFCCICMATPMVHVAALGSDLGLGPREAAGLLAVMMVVGMGGRVAFGRIADRWGSLPAYFVASIGQTALTVLFPYMETRLALYLLSALFGLVYSGAMTALILCAREYSPAGNVGLSIGLVMFAGWIGMALGAWQGGVFFDLCGDYFQAFSNASLSGLVNLLILVMLYLYTVHRPRVLARGAL